MTTHSLLDVVAILGLPITGIKAPAPAAHIREIAL